MAALHCSDAGPSKAWAAPQHKEVRGRWGPGWAILFLSLALPAPRGRAAAPPAPIASFLVPPQALGSPECSLLTSADLRAFMQRPSFDSLDLCQLARWGARTLRLHRSTPCTAVTPVLARLESGLGSAGAAPTSCS